MIGTLLRNRYRIDAKLGEGGMGVVYRAHDSLLQRPVAIKTLSPALFGEEGARRLIREAQSAAKLNHSHIVSIFDAVEEGGQFAIVMELVEGQTLRELLPVPVSRLVEITLQVLEGLEYAHAQGVVHRDIKPENIIVTKDGTAKLMDFGLARSEGRSRLTQAGMVVGTVAYMAPEQALQGTADAKSDLYALGCVLYEGITSHPPFEADDPIAVITQHINVPPVAPRFHTPDIPRVLEAVILKLLAKDPEKRYRSARDLAAALESLRGITAGAVGAPGGQDRMAGAELVQAVRRGAIVGRDEELHILQRSLDEAAGGDGRLVLIAGDAGVGKTRLVEELITYAHLRGVRVLSTKCYEGGSPYEPVVRMLREYLRLSPEVEVRQALGDYAIDLARLVPEVRQRLGGLPEGISLPPEQERARLFESVTRVFSTVSRTAPLLLFVDDINLADPATLQLLRYLAPAAAAERLLLIIAYQSEGVDRAPALAEILRQLRRERHAVALEAKPLTLSQVGQLIQAMSNHPNLPVRFASRIFEVTEGNPYFIEEVINALFEKGTLYIKDGEWSTDFDEGGRYAEMAVPATVRTAIQARLQGLRDGCRQVLTHAAVLGRQFRLDALAQVTGKDEEELVDLLDEALAARLLREVRVEGQDRYEFTQSMVREVLYEGISRHRRRRMHLRTGEALEQLYGIGPLEGAAELADHFLEAGEERRAVPYSIAAGERAQSLFAHEEAIRRFETARELLEDVGDTDGAIRLLERLGEPYLNTGQVQKAIECYERALGYYETRNIRRNVAELRRKIGHVHQMNWDFAAALPILEQALREFGNESGPDVVMLYLDLARTFSFTGKAEQGTAWARRALDLAEASHLTDAAATAHVELGVAFGRLRQFEEAEAHYREAIKLGKQANSYLAGLAVRRAINNLAYLEHLRGDLLTSLNFRKQSLESVEEVRDQFWLPFALVNVGLPLWRLGEWASARAYFRRVQDMGERAEGHLLAATFYTQFLDEDWEGALQTLQAVVAEAERRGDPQMELVGRSFMAEAALLLGRNDGAEGYARAAMEVKYEAPFWTWPELSDFLAESLVRQGRLDEAAEVCDRAEDTARAINGKGAWAAIHHVRGLIAAGRGKKDEALEHLQEAIRIYDEFPRPYDQARILEDLGALHRPRDRAAALEAYGRALATYDRLGANRSARRVRDLIETLQADGA